MKKAYVFDLFNTLAWHNRQEALEEPFRKYHEHLLATSLANSCLSEEERRRFLGIINDSEIRLYEDSGVVIRRLKEQGYKIGMISNIYEPFAHKIKRELNNFLNLFDYIYFSCERGMIKPEPAVFEYTLNELGVKPENSVMIGDDMKRDITPARELGMRAILIDRNTNTIEELIRNGRRRK